MIELTSTHTMQGKTKADYEKIVAYFESEAQKVQGWKLIKEPLLHRVTATQTVEVESL